MKIEQKDTGDPGRWIVAAGGQDTSGAPNWYFEANNRNKRSIALDLKKPEGLEIVHELAKKADVFVQNFRKGVADRIGVGYAALRELSAASPASLVFGLPTVAFESSEALRSQMATAKGSSRRSLAAMCKELVHRGDFLAAAEGRPLCHSLR